MIIKELLSEDLKKFNETIKDLLIETYMGNFQLSEEEAKTICRNKVELLFDYVKEGSATVVGAFDHNVLIGYSWLYIHEYFNEKRMHINQIAVNSRFRGKGVGKQLVHEAEKLALRKGIKTLDLFVSEINSGASHLYNKLGFETERRYMKKEL